VYDYDENGEWPPASVDDPDTFFKKPQRYIVINGYVVEKICEDLTPPPLPEA
jgi:hypothetical protein